MISRLFPSFGVENIRKFYFLTIFTNGWFVLSNWLFFFLMYTDRTQVGIIDGVAITIGIMIEIPTGAIGDLLGKKATLMISRVTLVIGILVIILNPSFHNFLIGNIILFIGYSLNSGTIEALGYDSLVEKGLKDKYDYIISKIHFLNILMMVFAAIVGGLLYSFEPRAPWVAWIIFEIIAFFILVSMKEPSVDTYKFNIKNYIKQNKEGVEHLFNKNLKPMLAYLFPLVLLLELTTGIFRQSMGEHFGYDGETLGYVFGLIFLIASFSILFFKKYKTKYGNKKFSILIQLGYAFGVLLALSTLMTNMLGGAIIILIFTISRNFSRPLISSVVNERIESKYRATTISVLTLLSNIPYIIIVLFFAKITDSENIHIFFTGFLITITICLILIMLNRFLIKNSTPSNI